MGDRPHNPIPGRPATVRYAEPDYWEARYQREPALFEWFFGYTALRRLIRTYISKKRQVLHVGCGTSNLQEGMARSGYRITNTDISEVVIKQMTQRHAQYSNMTYRVSDCRCMPEFMDCSFGHVLDKGTIDALLCCKQGTDNVMRMLLEIFRVLQPGGSFLLITLGDPTRRLPLLCDARLPWRVSLLLLPKISAANQAYVDGKPINDSTEPVEAQGPYEVIDADNIMDLPPDLQYTNFFFAYVCKKQPLQLPQHGGLRGQLPNGWVAGSKELFQKLQKEMGLPEDLLDKGRRKRVMHVPAGHATMSGLPYLATSSNASVASLNSAASGTGSPLMFPALAGSCSSSSVPAAAAAAAPSELQSALTVLQQQLGDGAHRHTPSSPAPDELIATEEGLATAVGVPHDVPARPRSAPDLLALNAAAEAAEAAAAAAAAAAVVPAGLAFVASPTLQLASKPLDGIIGPASFVSSPRGQPVAALLSGIAVPSMVLPAGTALPAELAPHSPAAAAEACGSSVCLPRLQQGPPAAVHVAELPQEGDVSMQSPLSMASTTTPVCGSPVLAHSISSPARLSPAAAAGNQQQQLLSPDAQQLQQPAALQQLFNFAAPGAVRAPHAAAEAAAGAVVSASLLEGSPLPPLGKPKPVVVYTSNSLTGSPSHASSSTSSTSQPVLAAFPGLKLQTGQVLPQLQGQLAAGAVSAATAAATAAGMYPHAAAPRSARCPRLRRFSTEYGALSGSALQQQLEQLRLIQAQHSESAADGLVLHDVAAGDSCSNGAVAAAAIAAAAWGAVRKPRDRRLSNISIMSGLSIMSSTSIDESGEDNLADDVRSANLTTMCSSEPSCLLWSPGRDQDLQEGGDSSASCGALRGASLPLSPLSSRASVEHALPEHAVG